MTIRAIIETHTNGIETINIERIVYKGTKKIGFAAVRNDNVLMTNKVYARKYNAVDVARNYLRKQLAATV